MSEKASSDLYNLHVMKAFLNLYICQSQWSSARLTCSAKNYSPQKLQQSLVTTDKNVFLFILKYVYKNDDEVLLGPI